MSLRRRVDLLWTESASPAWPRALTSSLFKDVRALRSRVRRFRILPGAQHDVPETPSSAETLRTGSSRVCEWVKWFGVVEVGVRERWWTGERARRKPRVGHGRRWVGSGGSSRDAGAKARVGRWGRDVREGAGREGCVPSRAETPVGGNGRHAGGAVEVAVMEEGWGSRASGGGGWSGQGQDRSDDLAEH